MKTSQLPQPPNNLNPYLNTTTHRNHGIKCSKCCRGGSGGYYGKYNHHSVYLLALELPSHVGCAIGSRLPILVIKLWSISIADHCYIKISTLQCLTVSALLLHRNRESWVSDCRNARSFTAEPNHNSVQAPPTSLYFKYILQAFCVSIHMCYLLLNSMC